MAKQIKNRSLSREDDTAYDRKMIQVERGHWVWLEARRAQTGESISSQIREALTEFIINEQDGRTTLAWKDFLRKEVNQIVADHIGIVEQQSREDVLRVQKSLQEIANYVRVIAEQEHRASQADIKLVRDRLEQLIKAFVNAGYLKVRNDASNSRTRDTE